MAYTTIKKPSDYFNTKLYTGTGATHNVTGVGFQPDWVWINNRTGTYATTIFDAVRGATKFLEPAGTPAEQTYADTLTSFDSDGFTLGADTSSFCNRGSAPNSYVAWNWLGANGTASNTDGSITSTVSANTTSGFSIVSYTGTGSSATVGHGLGAVPKMFMVKRRDSSGSWQVYHGTQGATKFLVLNQTGGVQTASSRWNNTEPTSSVFTVNTDPDVNGSSATYITYCFAEVKGFSKFGSYTGNGNADGSFIYLGFKPAFVIIKGSSFLGENWYIFDNKRTPSNEINKYLEANSSNTEYTYGSLDFLSNGFKNRINNSLNNQSGSTYIYMAFAESPFTTSTGIPTTGR